MPGFAVPADPHLSRAFLRRRAARPVGGPARYAVYWARNAIYHGLAAVGVGPGTQVLLPAFICRAAVEPILALGAEVAFHDVGPDCRIDPATVEARIGPRTRAVVMVHYFGFPQPADELRALCARRGVSLLEDCAHVLPGTGGPLGRTGDLAVFSWGKFLPVSDGGELVINRPGPPLAVEWEKEPLLLTLQTAKDALDRIVAPGRGGVLASVYGWLQASKRLLRRRRAAMLLPGDPDQAFDERMVRFPASRLSRWIAAHSDVDKIAARRREHYVILLEALAALPGVRPLFPVLPPGVCPWVLPVFLPGVREPQRRLREGGIPAAGWSGVRHPLVSEGAYPAADALYETLVFLPVHQGLAPGDLRLIAQRVRELVTAGGFSPGGS